MGDKVTKVICKLDGVPVSMGTEQLKGSCRTTTFYVLDCPSYHCILGLTLLQKIDAGVFCTSRKLQFTLGQAGKGATHTIALMPRSWVKTTPAYLACNKHPPRTVEGAAALPSAGWQSALVEVEALAYVEEGLADLLGVAAMNNEGGASPAHPPLPMDVEAVDFCSSYEPPTRPSVTQRHNHQPHASPPTCNCACMSPPSPQVPPHQRRTTRKSHHPSDFHVLHSTLPSRPPHPPPTPATAVRPPLEATAALEILRQGPPAAPWSTCAATPPDLSRACKKQLHCEATDSAGRASRGYGERKKKGKPISKQPLRKQLLAESDTKIVVTGPDFVGCTTLLQELHRVGYQCNFLRDKPKDRGEFNPTHF